MKGPLLFLGVFLWLAGIALTLSTMTSFRRDLQVKRARPAAIESTILETACGPVEARSGGREAVATRVDAWERQDTEALF